MTEQDAVDAELQHPEGDVEEFPDLKSDQVPDVETEVHDEPQSDEPDTFSRDYVEKLRDESAKYRQRAGRSDELAQRLHTELVRATGRLADPTDMPFDAEHLDDPERLSAAMDALLTAKPHLAARRPVGDIGQGATPSTESVSLLGLLRG